jgi:hypothetical protein
MSAAAVAPPATNGGQEESASLPVAAAVDELEGANQGKVKGIIVPPPDIRAIADKTDSTLCGEKWQKL